MVTLLSETVTFSKLCFHSVPVEGDSEFPMCRHTQPQKHKEGFCLFVCCFVFGFCFLFFVLFFCLFVFCLFVLFFVFLFEMDTKPKNHNLGLKSTCFQEIRSLFSLQIKSCLQVTIRQNPVVKFGGKTMLNSCLGVCFHQNFKSLFGYILKTSCHACVHNLNLSGTTGIQL